MADKTLSDPVFSGNWASYYEKTGQRPPRATLIRALDSFDREERPDNALAADLGCGSGRDTIEILRRGWPVHAVDASRDAIDGLLAQNFFGNFPGGDARKLLMLEVEFFRYLKSGDLVSQKAG